MAFTALAVQAQNLPSINRPAPASSNTSARAVDNFIRPVVPSYQEISNIAYDTVANNRGTLIPEAPSTKPWTAYFIGQQRCGSGVCAVVQGDGLLRWSSVKTGLVSARLPNMNEAFVLAASCQGMVGMGYAETWAVYPTGVTLTNSTPTDWVVEFGQLVCNPSGGGGNAN